MIYLKFTAKGFHCGNINIKLAYIYFAKVLYVQVYRLHTKGKDK